MRLRHEPEEERAELSAIYRNKGFSGPLLHHVVDYLTANQERWHRAMIHDELGVVEDTHINPWSEGSRVGLSFVIGGLIPAIPVIFSLPHVQWWAYALTALTATRARCDQIPLYPSKCRACWPRISRDCHRWHAGRCRSRPALTWRVRTQSHTPRAAARAISMVTAG